jgi:hypothetical protein
MDKNVEEFTMRICDSIGQSDHKTILINIMDKSMRIKRSVNLSMPFCKMLKDSETIGLRMANALRVPFAVSSMTKLIKLLRIEYHPVLRKSRSYFKLIKVVSNLGDPEVTRKLVRNSNRGAFLEFMNNFEKLKTSRKDKEYFVRLRFYSDLNSNVGILNNICINVGSEDTVSNDRDVINEVVFRKYSKLFHSDTSKRIPLVQSGKVLVYTTEMVRSALMKLNLTKATSWDCIPVRPTMSFWDDQNLLLHSRISSMRW